MTEVTFTPADKALFQCAVCRGRYQHGPHRYEGHRLKLYGNIFCCDPCWRGNHDGWAPHVEHALLSVLKEKGLPIPARTAKGLLPRD
jgi:hypothetical protein